MDRKEEVGSGHEAHMHGLRTREDPFNLEKILRALQNYGLRCRSGVAKVGQRSLLMDV